VQAYSCESDFEGPSDHLFLLAFLPTYLNLIYLRKYIRRPAHTLSTILLVLQALLIALTAFSGLLLGHAYLSQTIIGLVYGLFYLLLCLQLDPTLHILIEKSIFLQKKARKNKFRILFFVSGVLVIATVLFNLDMYNWRRPSNDWVSRHKAKC
jgi:membrane-associated phospholipid phosphatase